MEHLDESCFRTYLIVTGWKEDSVLYLWKFDLMDSGYDFISGR